MSEVRADEKDVKKGFWARLFEKLDQKMAEKVKAGGSCCCCSSEDFSKDKKCC